MRAEKLYQANATVLLQVQADMLGYHVVRNVLRPFHKMVPHQ